MRNPDRYPASAPASMLALALGVTVLAAGCGSDPKTCTPFVSRTFAGDHEPGVTANPQTWRKGILVHDVLPPKADALVAAFQTPGSAWYYAVISAAFIRQSDGNVGFRLGPGPLRIAIADQEPVGSAACAQTPDTHFAIANYSKIRAVSVLPAWTKSSLPPAEPASQLTTLPEIQS